MKRSRLCKRPRGRPFGRGADHPIYMLASRMASLRTLEAAYEQRISALSESFPSKPRIAEETFDTANEPFAHSVSPEALVRDVQQEFQRHYFGEFYEPGISEAMRGCVPCRRQIPNYPQFIRHLVADVIPASLRKATSAVPLDRSPA